MSVSYGYFLEWPIIEFFNFYERDRYFLHNTLCKFQYRSPLKITMYNALFLKKIFNDVTNYKSNIKFACFTCKIAPAPSIFWCDKNAIVKLVSVNHIHMVFAIFVKVFVRVVLNYLNVVGKNKYGSPQNQNLSLKTVGASYPPYWIWLRQRLVTLFIMG